jgi:hypothetical protein
MMVHLGMRKSEKSKMQHQHAFTGTDVVAPYASLSGADPHGSHYTIIWQMEWLSLMLAPGARTHSNFKNVTLHDSINFIQCIQPIILPVTMRQEL